LALVGYSREASETSWMMTIELEWCQVQAGAGVNLLESPQPGFDYVKPCWIMSIHAFLVHFDLRVEFTHTHRPKPLCDHDQFLMDTWRLESLPLTMMRKLNACRMWLQVSHY
jgi:hypothetical protein